MPPIRAAAAHVALSLALLSAGAAGCANNDGDSGGGTASVGSRRATAGGDFQRAVNQITPGTPKQTVLRELGRPDEKVNGVAGVPRPGPQPPLTLNAGSRYEHWVYLRGDSEYHVFMGPGTVSPGQWEVHSVSANPRSAVDRQ
jgi:hypothetical protein